MRIKSKDLYHSLFFSFIFLIFIILINSPSLVENFELFKNTKELGSYFELIVGGHLMFFFKLKHFNIIPLLALASCYLLIKKSYRLQDKFLASSFLIFILIISTKGFYNYRYFLSIYPLSILILVRAFLNFKNIRYIIFPLLAFELLFIIVFQGKYAQVSGESHRAWSKNIKQEASQIIATLSRDEIIDQTMSINVVAPVYYSDLKVKLIPETFLKSYDVTKLEEYFKVNNINFLIVPRHNTQSPQYRSINSFIHQYNCATINEFNSSYICKINWNY